MSLGDNFTRIVLSMASSDNLQYLPRDIHDLTMLLLKGGKIMAERLPLTTIGGSVGVSGISCRLPESDNMEELRQNLLNSKDMVTDYRRWDPGKFGYKLSP